MIRIPKGAGWPVLTPRETSAFEHVADVYPMPSAGVELTRDSERLYHGYESVDVVPSELYEKYDVKRGATLTGRACSWASRPFPTCTATTGPTMASSPMTAT